MTKKYDVVIVGAGPGGAMAAKTAGENGLKTAIIERKTNPSVIARGCGMMFAIESDYYFAERMYYNEKNKKMVFPVNGFSVDYDGPTRNFYAFHLYAPDGKTRLEFGNYEENSMKGDEGRLSLVFNKGKLIDGLMRAAERNGVDVFTGVNVNGIEKTATGVRVTGNDDIFEGTFVIGADGTSSRVAELMGFNKGRTYYGLAPGIKYYATGLSIPQSEAFNTAVCFKSINLPTAFFCLPSPYDEDEYQIAVRTQEDFEYVTKESIFSKWFTNIRVKKMRSFIISCWSPVSEPFRDNVLLVGDAAYFFEAEITGSMMCGWKAANALTVALRDNALDREGVLDYINWWKKSFVAFDDYRNFMTFWAFYSIFSQEELNYLCTLLKYPLRLTLNPFLVVRIVKKALEPMMAQVQKEMPSVAEKLKMLEIDSIDKLPINLKKF
jgi:flavin-dependent dehydrogenase